MKLSGHAQRIESCGNLHMHTHSQAGELLGSQAEGPECDSVRLGVVDMQKGFSFLLPSQ